LIRVDSRVVGAGEPRPLPWPGSSIRLLTASRTGVVAAADEDGVVRWAKVTAGSELAISQPVAREPRLTDLVLAPDGRTLVMVVDRRLVTLVDVESSQRIGGWDSGEHLLGPIEVSPDGQLLASGGDLLVVFRLLTGEPVAEVRGHEQPTDAIAFSPDGRFLATGSQDGLAKVWSVADWGELEVLRGHLLGVHAVAFSPDGRRLATGSVSGEAVKLWDLGVQQEVLTLAWPGVLVNRLAFSTDGSELLAGSAESGTCVWASGARGNGGG